MTIIKEVLVVGCGSVGSVLAARLSKVTSVTAYDVDRQIVSSINKNGIRVFQDKDTLVSARIPIFTDTKNLAGRYFDLVILATKAYDTFRAVRSPLSCVDFRRLLTVQNGLGNVETLGRYISPSSIFCGVTTMAARRCGAGRVDLFYNGRLYISAYNKNTSASNLKPLKSLFCDAGLDVGIIGDYKRIVWSKLIFNSVMNPLPLFIRGGYNAIRYDNRVAGCIHCAISEAKTVANRLGIRLAFDPLNIIREIESGRLGSFKHKGSMFDDISLGRMTEIEFLTGAVIREAKRLNVSVPALYAIYKSVKQAERNAQ